MNTHHLLSLLLGSTLAGSAVAGTAPEAKNPKGPVAPPVEESSMITGSVSLGYDTNYVYRGFEVLSADGDKAENLVWGALDLNAALTDKLSLNFNAWYASAASADYDELDLYTRLTYNLGPVQIGPSFKYYHYPRYPSPVDNQYEVGLEAFASPVENLAIGVGAFYEFEAEFWYFQIDANYTIKICDQFSLVPGATVSWVEVNSTDFALDLNGFHHITAYLKAPIKLAKNVVLTPYIAGNFPISDIDNVQDNIIYGGASLTVTF